MLQGVVLDYAKDQTKEYINYLNEKDHTHREAGSSVLASGVKGVEGERIL